MMLYVGLGMAAIGLVISFVDLGDKGFKTIELRLVGPSLLGCGLSLALLQVLYCTLPAACRRCCAGKDQAGDMMNTDKMRSGDGRMNRIDRDRAAQQLGTAQISLGRENTVRDNRTKVVAKNTKLTREICYS